MVRNVSEFASSIAATLAASAVELPELPEPPAPPPATVPPPAPAVAAVAAAPPPEPDDANARSFSRARRAVVTRRTKPDRRRTTVYFDLAIASSLAERVQREDRDMSDIVNELLRAALR